MKTAGCIVLVLICGGAVGCAGDPGYGLELVYQVLFPKDFDGERRAETRKSLDVLLKRARAMGWTAKGTVTKDDTFSLRIHEAEKGDLLPLNRLLTANGNVELYEVAGLSIQERFNKDRKIPEGCKSLRHAPTRMRQTAPEYAAWNRDEILVRVPAVVDAIPSQAMGAEGLRWTVTFTLDPDGARRFDEAGAKQFRAEPRGMIAIVVEDQVTSTPVVQADKFGGRGEITGGNSEEEARELAALLLSGRLEFPVGRRGKDGPEPRVPVSDREFGEKKKK